MLQRIPARIVLICAITTAASARGSTLDYLAGLRTRAQRHASCPSCHRDCPGALSSPWYGRAIYQQPSAGREHREVQPQSFAVGGQNYGSQYGQQIFRHPRTGPSRGGAASGSLGKFANACHREDPFGPRALRGIDPHPALATAASGFALEGQKLAWKPEELELSDPRRSLHASNSENLRSFSNVEDAFDLRNLKGPRSSPTKLPTAFKVEGLGDVEGGSLMGMDRVLGLSGPRRGGGYRDASSRGGEMLINNSENPFVFRVLRRIDGRSAPAEFPSGFIVGGPRDMERRRFAGGIGRNDLVELPDSRSVYRDTSSYQGRRLVDSSEDPFGFDPAKEIDFRPTPAALTPASFSKVPVILENQWHVGSNGNEDDRVLIPRSYDHEAPSLRGPTSKDKCENPFRSLRGILTPAVTTPAFSTEISRAFEPRRLAGLTMNRNLDQSTLRVQSRPDTPNPSLPGSHQERPIDLASLGIPSSAPIPAEASRADEQPTLDFDPRGLSRNDYPVGSNPRSQELLNPNSAPGGSSAKDEALNNEPPCGNFFLSYQEEPSRLANENDPSLLDERLELIQAPSTPERSINPTDGLFISEQLSKHQPRRDRSYEWSHGYNHQAPPVDLDFQGRARGEVEGPKVLESEERSRMDEGDSAVQQERMLQDANPGNVQIENESRSHLVDNGEVVEEERSIDERAVDDQGAGPEGAEGAPDMEPELMEDVENPEIEATEATIVEISSEGTTAV
ncbi:hypothetical protein KM043_012848 [Ampulex compressa]|nr:hypothetical protein KM043_012848 [Ampulex compressa]